MIPYDVRYLTLTSHLYVYSEYVVMWLNVRKRAIHDYIGGTVIIHDPRHTILPWRRLQMVQDKIQEISFEEFLEKYGKKKGLNRPENKVPPGEDPPKND